MTSKDARLTFDEDAQLYKLNKIIAERTKRANEVEEHCRRNQKELEEFWKK